MHVLPRKEKIVFIYVFIYLCIYYVFMPIHTLPSNFREAQTPPPLASCASQRHTSGLLRCQWHNVFICVLNPCLCAHRCLAFSWGCCPPDPAGWRDEGLPCPHPTPEVRRMGLGLRNIWKKIPGCLLSRSSVAFLTSLLVHLCVVPVSSCVSLK